MGGNRKPAGERASLYVASGVLCLFWLGFGAVSVDIARRHDFLNIYTGASLAVEGRWNVLHDTAAQFQKERALVPDLRSLVPFVRPPFYAFLLAPLGGLPFGSALWTWIAIQCGLYCAAGFWALRRFEEEGLFFWSLFFPGAVSIGHGQDAPVMLAFVLAGFVLAERGKSFVAGLVLSLALIKFHLCLGLAAALLAGRMWRIFWGFCAGGLGLAAFSIALGGKEGLANYLSLLTNKNVERLSPAPEKMTNIQGLMANLGIESAWIAAAAGAVALAMLLYAAWQAPLWKVLAAGLAGGMFIMPHVYMYDTTALLPFLLLSLQPGEPRPLRIAAFALVVPLIPLLSLLGPPISAFPALAVMAYLSAMAWTRRCASRLAPATLADQVEE